MSKPYYSQNDEEKYILEILGTAPGELLDLGAYDGKTFSNTLRLVELGWKGVCVEPALSVLPALRALHGENPNVQILEVAVTRDFTGKTKFLDSAGDAVSTLSAEHRDKWEKGSSIRFHETEVNAISMPDLFRLLSAFEFEFINLDVEGTNIDLFRLLPFEALTKLRCICVEHDQHDGEIVRLAGAHGFTLRHVNAENVILAR